ncbi:MAG TPA: tRNA 2-selenouridine(34) synthase MnmH [Bacteroidales bacterium]|mgnify:CR=1 FL=1|nr:tRNA 2-selenouridine(34) synthase MnmH [Bacteroidales bacterium]HOX73336.1 tRNA 2-selenouridine(34) synthase MnmH [Bacteroidales bacterium]HPM86566.1 tRNA 2-selenouridine(34) synthase MnmH [Bacteroidales bacterium]HQM67842.1 tRNA 2-selenouridine(34) synthase MnmH [Bacteroidales bacterium]
MNKTDICRFLELSEKYPVIDVRSPSEYLSGHIPGSINIPLFDDNERKAVGIKYKNAGRVKAILKGLELAGPSMHNKLSEAIKAATDGKLLVHCWRGGIRSEAMAWLFSLADIQTEVLEGGYKSYRNHILSSLSEKRKMIIVGGMTGSGKTHILNYLKSHNHQIIDLEGIACHKGSAFGALGQQPQPTSEHFANLLFEEWRRLDHNMPVWIEDESRNIGNVFIPDNFYNNMLEAPAIVIMMDIKTRLPRLTEEYAGYPPGLIKESILKIRKRLGGDNTADALRAVDEGRLSEAVEITLKYYDKAYMYGISRRSSKNIVYVETDTDDIGVNAGKVIDAAAILNL